MSATGVRRAGMILLRQPPLRSRIPAAGRLLLEGIRIQGGVLWGHATGQRNEREIVAWTW